MNERLTSSYYKGREAVLHNAVVAFDGHGHCKGIVRYSGDHPLEEPKEIGEVHLNEAKHFPEIFTVKDEEEVAAKKSKAKVAAPTPVAPEPVEVADTKAVVDAEVPNEGRG